MGHCLITELNFLNKYLMFPKRICDGYGMPTGTLTPPDAKSCPILDVPIFRRSMAVARYRMICVVLDVKTTPQRSLFLFRSKNLEYHLVLLFYLLVDPDPMDRFPIVHCTERKRKGQIS